jgi:hypothetical protein
VGHDSSEVIRNRYIPSKFHSKMTPVKWEIKQRVVEKNSLMILDLLAHNDWKRPVCFASTMGSEVYLGLDQYLFLEGLAYRLLPVNAVSGDGQTGEVNTDVMYDNLMNKFTWGNMQDPGVWLDENNVRMTMNYRNAFGRLASQLIIEGKPDSARKVLDRSLEVMPDKVVPMNYFMTSIIEGYYKLGDSKNANALSERLFQLYDEDLAYLYSFPEAEWKSMDLSMQEDLMTIDKLRALALEFKQDALEKKIMNSFQKYYQQYVEKVYQRE